MMSAFHRILRLAPLGLAFSLCAAAEAGQQKHTAVVRLDAAPFAGRAAIPQFDPALGDLQSATVRVRARLAGSLGIENIGTEAASADSLFAMRIGVRSALPCVVTPSLRLQDALSEFDGALDYAGSSGITHASLDCEATSMLQSIAEAADLARFKGTGHVLFQVAGEPLTSTNGSNGQVQSTSSVHAEATIEVVYEYTTFFGCSGADLVCENGTAVVTTHQVVFGPQPFNWSSGTPGPTPELRLPKFRPAPGTCQNLIQADITVSAALSGSVAAENSDPFTPCTVEFHANGNYQVALTNVPALPPFNLSNSFDAVASLSAADGVLDFGGPSGVSLPVSAGPATLCRRVVENPGVADLRLFVDTTPGDPSDDDLVFQHLGTALSSTDGCQNFSALTALNGTLVVTVRYVACTVLPPTAVPDAFQFCPGPGVHFLPVFSNDLPGSIPVSCVDNELGALVPPSAGTLVLLEGSPACVPGGPICPQSCVQFVPNPLFAGVATFEYTLRDRNGCASTTTVALDLSRPNLQNDSASTCRGLPVDVCVFVNDTSARPLSCPTPGSSTGISNLPFGWSATWVPAPGCGAGPPTCTGLALRVVPNPGFVGSASLIYTLSDAAGCSDSASVTVVVRTPPSLVPQSRAVCAGSPIEHCVFVPATSDTPLVCPPVGSSQGIAPLPPGWSASWVLDAACAGPFPCTGLGLRVVPPPGFVGNQAVTYTVIDTDGCSATESLLVQVLPGPIAADDAFGVCSGFPTALNVLANDTSAAPVNCGALMIAVPPAHGVVTVTNDPSCANALCGTTCVRYTPVPGFVGLDQFQYQLTGTGGCNDVATVTVQVCGTTAPTVTAQVCPGESVEICLPVTSSCGPVNCSTLSVAQPAQGSIQVVACGAGCDGCCVRYTAAPTPPQPPGDVFSMSYSVASGGSPACVAVGSIVVSVRPAAECVPTCTSDSILAGGASVLVYPEFDNRAGARTLVTVTNTHETLGTKIEFVYIGRVGAPGPEYCQEFNREAYLTANDTLTVLTNFHNPFTHQGYVYVFAKNALGQAVAFDALIGNLVHLDGITFFNWSVNPFAYASPLPLGTPTDLNTNDLRDLDGIEYARSPDRILVPRFLGQAAPFESGFQSDLILLPLSGGVQFVTLIDFLLFNDNEQVFSAQASVQCWDKRSLVSISPAFREDFLDSLASDDPNEIVGEADRNAGWFQLEGQIASSGSVAISNPVVLAVLVETHVGGGGSREGSNSSRRVADLPFALGESSNGKLLSFSLFGN